MPFLSYKNVNKLCHIMTLFSNLETKNGWGDDFLQTWIHCRTTSEVGGGGGWVVGGGVIFFSFFLELHSE